MSLSRGRGDPDASEVIASDVPVSSGAEVRTTEAGAYRVYAGPRSDPFFADVAGVMNKLQFTGTDSLANVDVYAIVLEVPNQALGDHSQLGVWATVRIPATGTPNGTRWVQVERAGRPEMVNFYCQGDDKVAFNAGEPAQDRTVFLARFAHALEHMGQYAPEQAVVVAETLLPDMLPYDYARPSRLPESGRELADDAFDQALSVYLQRAIDDGVGPHTDLLSEFPYLGPPHQARGEPTPSAVAAASH